MPIKRSNVTLNSYNKSLIRPIGAIEITFEFSNTMTMKLKVTYE